MITRVNRILGVIFKRDLNPGKQEYLEIVALQCSHSAIARIKMSLSPKTFCCKLSDEKIKSQKSSKEN